MALEVHHINPNRAPDSAVEQALAPAPAQEAARSSTGAAAARGVENRDAEAAEGDGAQSSGKRARTVMALEVNALCDDTGLDQDDEEARAEEASRVFEEALPRLRAAGSAYHAPAADELVPARPVFGAESGKQLDPQQCAEGRRRELSAMEEQEALLVVPLGAAPRDAKKVRAKWVEDVRGDSAKSRFVATQDERRGVFTWAGNSKHVHDAAETLGLLGEVHNNPNKGARPCEGSATPGSKSDGSGIADAEQPLDAAERARFTSAADS